MKMALRFAVCFALMLPCLAQDAPQKETKPVPGAAASPDGSIYVVGVVGNGNVSSTVVESYQVRNDTWTILPGPSEPARSNVSVATDKHGRLYILAGGAYQQAACPTCGPGEYLNWAMRYDPGTRTWTRVADVPQERSSAAAATGPDGRIYLFGGEALGPIFSDSPTVRLDRADVYQPDW